MDRTTKILLAAIAAGLFANAVRPAVAQSIEISEVARTLRSIADGSCANTTLCSQLMRRP